MVSALKARSEQDVEEADDSLVVIPWTLSQARAASEGVKAFVHSNLEEHPELRKYMAHVEDLETLLENMTLISTIKANYATPGPAWLALQRQQLPSLGQRTIRDSKQAEDSKRWAPDGGVYYLG